MLFFFPLLASAQQPYARYCPDGRIFTGVNYDDEGRSPLIALAVDPAFNEKMKRERFTPDLPVAPIYDLVFTVVPTINEYCLPQYNAEGQLVRKVDPPKTLPFTASIELGPGLTPPAGPQQKVVVRKISASETLISASSLQWNGKRDEKERPIYEWKLKGWKNGIVSEGKMERLIRAVHDNNPPLKLVVDMKFPDGTRKRAERAASFSLCAPVWGSGRNEMVYSRVAHRLSDFTYQANSIVEEGFLKIDPFRAYQKWFSHLYNLRNYQGKRWTNVHSDAKVGLLSIPQDCGNTSATHISISPLVPPGDFASALTAGRFVQIASDVTKRIREESDRRIFPFFFNLPMPLIALHEIGHAFAFLKDEYVALLGLAISDKNCALNSSPDASTWIYNGIRYGDNNIKGCYGSESYRPSQKSLMKGAQSGSTFFNVVSCGYIIGAIKGGTGPEYWEECMNPQWNTIKPTGKSTSLNSQLASVFSSLFSPPAPTALAAAVGNATEGGQEIRIEHFSADGTITGETITVPAITYVPMPLADVPAEDDIGESAGGGDESVGGLNFAKRRGERVMELFDETGRVYKTIPLPSEEYIERPAEERLIAELYRRAGDFGPSADSGDEGNDVRSTLSRAVTTILDAAGSAISRITKKSSIPRGEQAATYPIRNLVLDTLGKPLALTETAAGTFRDATGKEWPNAKGVLTDAATGQSWDIEYEKKGHSRERCNPPVLNLTFDKKTKKGKPKPLFNGLSSYGGFGSLEYQKVRFIPDCDVFDDGWSNKEAGFANTVNVLLRESMLYDIARIVFKLPAVDVVGIASLTLRAPGNDASAHRYMLLQRDNEQDDQVPFTSQFGLRADLVEASDAEEENPQKTIKPGSFGGDGLTSVTYVDLATEKTKTLELDPENALRARLFYAFVNMSDHQPFWNEDYGFDRETGLAKVIPYDFDLALYCRFSSPQSVVSRIRALVPPEKQAHYMALLDKAAREIFGSRASLDRMLVSIERYPFPTENKARLRDFLTVQFESFATQVNSDAFAAELGTIREPLSAKEAPPASLELEAKKRDFLAACKRPPLSDFSKGHVFAVLPRPTLDVRRADANNLGFSLVSFSAKFLVETRAGTEPLRINTGRSFEARMQREAFAGAGIPDSPPSILSFAFTSASLREPSADVQFERGIYTIPAGKTATFSVTAFHAEQFLAGANPSPFPDGIYRAFLSKISLGDDYFITPEPVLSNAAELRTLPRRAAISIASVEPSRIEPGQTLTVRGRGFTLSGTFFEGILTVPPHTSFVYFPSDIELQENPQGEQIMRFALPRATQAGVPLVSGRYALRAINEQAMESAESIFLDVVIPPAKRSSIRVRRAAVSETFQPRELPIGRTPWPLGSADIVASEAVRMTPAVFRLVAGGDARNAARAMSFELWQLNPIQALEQGGRISEDGERIIFKTAHDFRAGTTTLVIIASPLDRFVPGQRLTLSADFYKDDVEAVSAADPRRRLSFPKGEVLINTLVAVSPPEAAAAKPQPTADVLRAPAGGASGGMPNLSTTQPIITGSSAGRGKLFAGELTLRAAIRNEGRAVPQTFGNTLQYRDAANNGQWTDWVKFEVPGLDAGGRADVTHRWEGGAGAWEFRLVADSDARIAEADEEDNYSPPYRVSIVLRPGASASPPPPSGGAPKLFLNAPVVSGRHAGAGKLVAGTMTIKGKATNIGDAAAPPFQILLLYSTDGQNWRDWVRIDSLGLAPEAERGVTYSWEGGAGGWYVKMCEDITDDCSPAAFFEVVPL